MAAAVQRIAIEAERHRFTFRQTRRTVAITFSMMLVQVALLSFVESSTRAYRLKASNGAPPISTSSGTISAA
jgi:hypothetical protein